MSKQNEDGELLKSIRPTIIWEPIIKHLTTEIIFVFLLFICMPIQYLLLIQWNNWNKLSSFIKIKSYSDVENYKEKGGVHELNSNFFILNF